MWVHEQPAQPPLKAVVDRIVDGRTAVLLVGDDEREMPVPVETLPEGVREGSWLRFDPQDGSFQLDEEETARRRAAVQDKLARLRQRGRRLAGGSGKPTTEDAGQ